MKVHVRDGDAIRKKAIENGMGVKELAEKINVTGGHLSNILNGRAHPRPVVAKKMVECLRCDFEEIFFVK
ncbi:helix-turn-helix transcriptional regulator [Bacillus sp. FSL W7-1360]